MATFTLGDELETDARRLIALCAKLSLQLSRRASLRMAIKRVAEVLTFSMGLVALAIAGAQIWLGQIGPDLVGFIATLAGFTLISGVIVDRIFSDPPERFVDCSFYVGAYEGAIREILNDDADEARPRRLREVLRLAEKNINDVRTKWPLIYAEAVGG